MVSSVFVDLIGCHEFLAFVRVQAFGFFKVKLGYGHQIPLITSRGMQMVCLEEFLLRDRPDKELHKAIQNIERRIGGYILL